MTAFGIAALLAEVLAGPHLHVPDWAIAVNSNLARIPLIEGALFFAVFGGLMLRYGDDGSKDA